MAKGKSKRKTDGSMSPRIVNRRARHDYHIEDTLEAGLKLLGSEVKSIRNGRVQLSEGFVLIDVKTQKMTLHNVDIALYPQAGPLQHEPRRTRTLLAHKREIAKWTGAASDKGTTIVPLAMYFVRGKAKVEIGLARGKKSHDKRQDLKKREAERAIRRGMTRKVL
jgi:SsrA-binding protein